MPAVHVVAVVHAPDGFGAKLADVKREVRRLEITTPARDEVLQILTVFRLEVLAEHVVLPLVPHEAFELVGYFPSVQFGER